MCAACPQPLAGRWVAGGSGGSQGRRLLCEGKTIASSVEQQYMCFQRIPSIFQNTLLNKQTQNINAVMLAHVLVYSYRT